MTFPSCLHPMVLSSTGSASFCHTSALSSPVFCLAIISPPTFRFVHGALRFHLHAGVRPKTAQPLPSAAESLRVTDRAAVAAMNAVPAVVVQKDQMHDRHVIHNFVHPVELLDASVRPALGDRVEHLHLHSSLHAA